MFYALSFCTSANTEFIFKQEKKITKWAFEDSGLDFFLHQDPISTGQVAVRAANGCLINLLHVLEQTLIYLINLTDFMPVDDRPHGDHKPLVNW